MATATKRRTVKTEERVETGERRILIPFVRAAHQFVEGPFMDESRQPGANAVALGPFDVPARGYLRHIYLLAECSGGVVGPGVLDEDAPWNAISALSLTDVNGTVITSVGPGDGGFHLYLQNLIGGYAFESDPAALPGHDAAVAAFAFALRIPVEVTERDGFGSIVNQDSSSNYQLYLTVNTSAAVWSTPPTTVPTIRFRAWVEGWTQPQAQDLLGNPQAIEPPGHGSTQFVTEQQFDVNAGRDSIEFTRKGNLIRTLILVNRTLAGVRSLTNFPDPLELDWDSRRMFNISRTHLRNLAFERIGRTLPTGVFVISYIHDDDGHNGNEGRFLYLPTVRPTRLEIAGAWGAASNVTVLTNDIAPKGAPVRPTG